MASSRNPMGYAWQRALSVSGLVARVATFDEPLQHWGPATAAQFTALRREPSHDRASLDSVGFTPDVIFVWWGLGMVASTAEYLNRTFPGVPVVLCVDTYPNASVVLTELREWATFLPRRRHVSGFVTTGTEMTHMLRRRGLIRREPTLELNQPLALETHASNDGSVGVPDTMLFSGRSDFLYSRDPRMAKDALGPALEGFMKAGMTVTVQEPLDESAKSALEERGYVFYSRFSNEAMVDGRFSDFAAGFGCQLVSYEIPSGVIRRRVNNGLSTRWTFGLASPTPLVAPGRSGVARSFFAAHPVGLASDDPRHVVSELRRCGDAMRDHWHRHHHIWSAEGMAGPVLEYFASIT